MRTAGRTTADAVRSLGWHGVRVVAGTLYAVVLGWIVVVAGVPTGRPTIAVLIVTALVITRLGHGWRAVLQVVLDWLPFTLVLMAYDKTRALADTIGLPLHVSDVVDAEKWMFGGTVPTVWMQQHLYQPGHVYWYDALATLVYTSHFVATPVLAAWLWVRERAEWLRYIGRVIALSVAGLATYVLFPEAPPWYAAKEGVIPDPIARLSARGWEFLHLGDVQRALAHAQEAGSNPVAAMPSLHVAFAATVALFIASRLRTRWRWLLALYPVAMGATLVYTGEHYVLDLLAGVAYAWAVHAAFLAWERRRPARAPREIRTVDGRPLHPVGADPEQP